MRSEEKKNITGLLMHWSSPGTVFNGGNVDQLGKESPVPDQAFTLTEEFTVLWKREEEHGGL